jgi:hypothetical protein
VGATATLRSLYTPSWKELYQRAINETDLTKVPERITDAENALVLRARELFYSSGNGIEEESMDDAMCILRALRSSLKRRLASGHGLDNFEWPSDKHIGAA